MPMCDTCVTHGCRRVLNDDLESEHRPTNNCVAKRFLVVPRCEVNLLNYSAAMAMSAYDPRRSGVDNLAVLLGSVRGGIDGHHPC